MGLAITEEHQELARVAERYLSAVKVAELTRNFVDGAPQSLQSVWDGMVEQAWPGVHIGVEYGGQGYGLAELVVLVEQLGRHAAPGNFTATAVVSAAIGEVGTAEQKAHYLPQFASGSRSAGLALNGAVRVGPEIDGGTGPIIGGAFADVIAIVVGDDVALVDADCLRGADGELDVLDRTLGLTRGEVVAADRDRIEFLHGGGAVLRVLARTLYAAEACGVAAAALEEATEYAKVREQFGRPIGSFQAVKHHCANMCVEVELAVAAAWDAAGAQVDADDRDIRATAAAAAALEAAVHNAQLNIQVHGGIGFTWEHDAHIFARRAVSLAQLIGPIHSLYDEAHAAAAAGRRRAYTVALPDDAEVYRAEVREFLDRYRASEPGAARELIIDSGYATPHWPKPYGRGAGPVEQLVVDEELNGVKKPTLGIGGWVVLTLLQHASPDQLQRWVRPSMMGEYTWCQLFSEPGAGSDASAISTKAINVDGGWRITGQKIWTSGAEACNRGMATVRTDSAAAKRDGISMVVIDMHAPGVMVRPLKEITGLSLFNEVFLDDVFVPDDDVVGDVGKGWSVARATLGNERISIGGGGFQGVTALDLVELLDGSSSAGDTGLAREVGRLIIEEQCMHLLDLRRVARALAETGKGQEGNINKLVVAEHSQRVSELGMSLLGTEGVTGDAPRIVFEYLFSRCLTIGGGTAEISRNVIGERILGLPRDPSID